MAETFAAMGDIAANLLHHVNNKVGTIPVRVDGIQQKRAELIQNDSYLAANLSDIRRSATEAMSAMRESLSLLNPLNVSMVGVASSVDAAIHRASPPASIAIRVEGLEDLPPVVAGQKTC